MSGARPPASAGVRLANLGPAQELAVRALVVSGSVVEAAKVARVTERTVRRWLTSDDFRAAYRAAARDSAAEAMSALLAAQQEAVCTLVDALRDASPPVRVRAARVLLEIGRHAADDDFDQRLTQLEQEATAWRDRPTLTALPG